MAVRDRGDYGGLKDTWDGRWPCRCETSVSGPRPRRLHGPGEMSCDTCGKPRGPIGQAWECWCEGGAVRHFAHYVRLQPRGEKRCDTCGTTRDEVLA